MFALLLTCRQANALVNTAIEDGRIDELRVMVLDELHMIDEENRGYIMELMITKLLVLQQKIQIVGMSATLSVMLSVHVILLGAEQIFRTLNCWLTGWGPDIMFLDTGPSPSKNIWCMKTPSTQPPMRMTSSARPVN